MKIIIIGGAGYIGSHVTRAFLDKGEEIVVYDNLSSGSRENLFPEADFIHGDIMDVPKLSASMKGCDAIVHLAALKAAGESMAEPGKYAVNNISGTINIINCAADLDIRYLVFSSSAAVYGEPKYTPIDENHPTTPENFYGFTKLEIERFLPWYEKLHGIKSASLRYFNAAGYDVNGRILGLERNPANLLPVIMEVAAGMREKLLIYGDDYPTRDGTGVRDYIHVNDLAEAHVSGLQYIKNKEESLTVNLGSEEGVSVFEMVETTRKITGKPVPTEVVARRPGDPAELVASAKKAEQVLHWKARYSDVETLVSTSWKAYQANR